MNESANVYHQPEEKNPIMILSNFIQTLLNSF